MAWPSLLPRLRRVAGLGVAAAGWPRRSSRWRSCRRWRPACQPVHRQQHPLPAAVARLDDLNGHVLLHLGQLPISSGRTSRVMGPWYWGARGQSAWRTALHPPVDRIGRRRELAKERQTAGSGPAAQRLRLKESSTRSFPYHDCPLLIRAGRCSVSPMCPTVHPVAVGRIPRAKTPNRWSVPRGTGASSTGRYAARTASTGPVDQVKSSSLSSRRARRASARASRPASVMV
jgi:hypothetical protein